MQSAPKVLNEREQMELLMRFLDHGDISAKDKLIEHNLRLVYHIAKKYKGGSISDDDLAGIGSVGLIKAVRTFNPGRGVRLATYAARCIENEMLMALRHSNKVMTNEPSSLDDVIGVDRDGEELYLRDVIHGDNDAADEAIRRSENEDLAAILRQYPKVGLKERDVKVLYLRFGFGDRIHTQREISEMLGISRSYVSRIEKKSVMKLRKNCPALSG